MDYQVKVSTNVDSGKLDALESRLQKLKSSKINISVNTAGDISQISNQLSSIRSKKIKINTDTSDLQKSKSDFQMLKNLANEISQKKIKLAGLDTSKNANQFKELSSQVKKLESDYSVLNKSLGDSLNTEQIGKLNNILGKTGDKVSEIKAKAKDMGSSLSAATKPFNTLDAVTASNKTLAWLNNNTKAAKDYGEALKIVADKQKNATNTHDLSDANKEYRNIVSTATLAGKTGNNLVSEIARAGKQIGQFVGIYGVLQQGVQVARQMASAVIDVDSAMTELSKVSDAPSSQITSYFDQATESAKKYGAMISDVILSTSDWSRLGYDLKDSAILSDATTLLQKVGDNMTQESSSEGLISILKGFNKEADDVGNIIDVVNEVANKEPIDTAGIVSALQRSASSLSAAGNDMNQSIAMITAANSVVQDPESVGTAYKTMSMRIRGAKTDLESAGLETDGMAESTAKLQEELLALSNVNIMKDKNTFKSTYDILDGLADKWESFSDIQQASITELIAGKRQGNVMSALMSNWDIAEETLEVAKNSDGSAEKELGNYQKSIQYSLDKFKAQFQETSTSVIDSDIFKGAIDGATGLLDILTQITGLGNGAGLAGILSAGVGIAAFVRNLD